MGVCLSLERTEFESHKPTTAKVVSLKGILLEYKVPVSVYQVLEAEPSSSSSSSLFLCNSDHLLFDDYIPALNSDVELEANQIYFVLPASKLQYKLSASDMAALAVKASVAIQNGRKKESNRQKRARISPVIPVNHDLNVGKDRVISLDERSETETETKTRSMSGPNGVSRSGSVRKLQRFSSRRAKLAVRSFKLKLATIYEGIVV